MMRVLIAEDDPVSRRALEATLSRWGYEVTVTSDGEEAWSAAQDEACPKLVILDWMMPGMTGPEVCAKVRTLPHGGHLYVLLLTAKDRTEDVVAGLEAGADDYICKPFHPDELEARVRAGRRIIELQAALADRIDELERAQREVRELQDLLPICAYCKKIREGDDYWRSLEAYFHDHSDTRFSHGICPDCYDRVVRPQLDDLG